MSKKMDYKKQQAEQEKKNKSLQRNLQQETKQIISHKPQQPVRSISGGLANTGNSSSNAPLAGGGAARSIRGVIDWVDIKNRPNRFPPSAHEHTLSEITDFEPTRQFNWRGYFQLGNTYNIGDVVIAPDGNDYIAVIDGVVLPPPSMGWDLFVNTERLIWEYSITSGDNPFQIINGFNYIPDDLIEIIENLRSFHGNTLLEFNIVEYESMGFTVNVVADYSSWNDTQYRQLVGLLTNGYNQDYVDYEIRSSFRGLNILEVNGLPEKSRDINLKWCCCQVYIKHINKWKQ